MRTLLTTLLVFVPLITTACGGMIVDEPRSKTADPESAAPEESSTGGGSSTDSTAPPKGSGAPPKQGGPPKIASPAGSLASTVGAITLVYVGKEARFALHDGRSVSLTLTGYDSASNRSSFHYALLDSSGTSLEAREVTYGPKDMGGELEVHKTGLSWRALISVPETITATAAIGDTLLLNLGEEGHIKLDAEREVQLRLTGFDAASGRNQFHYVVSSTTNGLILETRDIAFGPQDIGWEIEVLKSSSQRALVTVATSKRWAPAINTTRGRSILFQGSNEAASVALPISESLTYVGYDSIHNRSSFHYQAQNHFNQLITMGPQDIGWEMEVLKTEANRSLVTLAVSDR